MHDPILSTTTRFNYYYYYYYYYYLHETVKLNVINVCHTELSETKGKKKETRNFLAAVYDYCGLPKLFKI
jgi:hypothetical protein